MKRKLAAFYPLGMLIVAATLVLSACGAQDEDVVEVPTAVATFTPGAVIAAAAEEPAEAAVAEAASTAPTAAPTVAPTATEPATTEPATTEPATTEPTETEPVETEPAEATPTPAETPELTETVEITDVTEITEVTEITGVAEITETVEITEAAPIAEAEEVTEAADITVAIDVTATTAITPTAAVTEVEALTPTVTMTETDAVTAPADAAGAEAAGAPAEIYVEMHDLYFGEEANNISDPPVWSAPAGAEVTLLMDNFGSVEHNWAIVELGAEIPVPFVEEENQDILIYDAGRVQPGESAETTFTAPSEPGTYTVICTVPGHYPVMQGLLVVE